MDETPSFKEDHISQIPYIYHLTYLASYGVHIEKMTFSLRLWLKSKISIPSNIKEQLRIKSVFDSINKEIAALEQYSQALKDQKKGLMHVLLTGKVRVKVGVANEGDKYA